MPVPWMLHKHRSYIPHIAERALTVKQLCDLRIFLQRLCKAKLLTRRQASNADPLQWHQLNLYHVTDEVIKPVISFRAKGAHAGYSWAELVAEGPQKPQLMVSHWWGGRFVDFMYAIDRIVDDKALGVGAALWICTFANNQFGEDFGANIRDTPFVQAIQQADATILMVDRDAGSLRRSWCCLELHYTILQEKSLEFYTSAGPIGSKTVSSGLLVDAISEWDVRESAASEEAYRRQILNFIAEVPEHSGLLTASGKLLLSDDQRPQVDPSVNQEQYEREFMDSQRKAFEDLNMNVRFSVIGSIGRQNRAKGCRIPDASQRGITLGQLRTFARKASRAFKKMWPEVDWQKVSTDQVCEHFVLPQTRHFQSLPPHVGCSYVELVADGPQFPSIYIDYQFSMFFADIMACVEWLAEALRLKDSDVFYFNLLGYNQHCVGEEIRANSYDQDNNLAVDKAQSGCHSFLLASSAATATDTSEEKWTLCRAWRLYNIECAVSLGQAMYITCPSGVMACTKLFPNGHSKFGTVDPSIIKTIFETTEADILQAPCALEEDRKKILAFLQGGHKGLGVQRLQLRLQRWSAFHLALVLAGNRDDPSLLQKILSIPGFSIHSEFAKGALGESALHKAVAGNRLRTVEMLLDLGLSPNSTDAMQETPLHYAVLAGDAAMVDLLIARKADPIMESTFGETALEVAAQNAAAFLGHESAPLARQLEEAEQRAFLESESASFPSISPSSTFGV
ncbi:unnamed protein product [Effrenium voratum]|uniref:Uncharacterized protein n=1 Tax=Effrenium voratum TaxID=2562239 RepID=A0AA36HKH8_9DINO|nr:unnamed protein product [Effrenium voratum]CAJ1437450.1 unnamed protein product [Effrenium voratum]